MEGMTPTSDQVWWIESRGGQPRRRPWRRLQASPSSASHGNFSRSGQSRGPFGQGIMEPAAKPSSSRGLTYVDERRGGNHDEPHWRPPPDGFGQGASDPPSLAGPPTSRAATHQPLAETTTLPTSTNLLQHARLGQRACQVSRERLKDLAVA
jgi:hypothetical protein